MEMIGMILISVAFVWAFGALLELTTEPIARRMRRFRRWRRRRQ